MTYLVAGKKNIGKTTRLKQLFESTPDSWGFCAEKQQDCGRVTAYELVDLRTSESKVTARLTSLPTPKDWGEEVIHGPFRFSTDSFAWAMDLFKKARDAGASTFFIDELGKLELKGSGHAGLIKEAISSDMDLYIAIRDMNVKDAVESFGIKEYEIIAARD